MYDDVSIIFPALNEKERILPTLKDYILTLGPSVEYIVVDNGSTDGTQEAVLAKFPHVIYVRNEFPLGKGGAVYAGFDVAKGLIVGFTDPDGATSAKEFIKLLNKAKTSDVVIGSRWLPGSKISPQQPFIRQINSRAFNLAIKTLLPLSLSDTQCGAKVLKKSVYENIKPYLTQKQFSFDVDLLYHAHRNGFTITEVPILWSHIEGGGTFKPFQSGFRALWDILNIRKQYS